MDICCYMVVGFGAGALFCGWKVLNLRWNYRFIQLMETHIPECTFLNAHFGTHVPERTFGTHISEHIFNGIINTIF